MLQLASYALFLCAVHFWTQPLTSEDGQSQYCMTSKPSVHRPTWNVPLGYFLARSWAVRLDGRWELAFLVEETVGVLTTNLSMSKFLSLFNERNYILPKNWQLHLFFTPILPTWIENCVIISVVCIYQPFRLAYLNKGRVCVSPIGNSLRIRLVPGPRHAK